MSERIHGFLIAIGCLGLLVGFGFIARGEVGRGIFDALVALAMLAVAMFGGDSR